MKSILKISISLLLLAFLSSCLEQKGTDVDNPMFQEPNCDGSKRCMPTPYVQIQMHQICQKVNSCLGIADDAPEETCSQLLPQQIGLENFILTTATNYSELDTLYRDKKLDIHKVNAQYCMSALEGLTCDSSVFTSAFNVNDPNNYSGIHNILLADVKCLSVYSEK